jgi:hypothetical protein
MTTHACCYANCPEPGLIHIGPNGGDTHWICWFHYCKWHADRARFLADGGGCAMQDLGELPCELDFLRACAPHDARTKIMPPK